MMKTDNLRNAIIRLEDARAWLQRELSGADHIRAVVLMGALEKIAELLAEIAVLNRR
jgi:hypothetical protein